MPLPETVLPRPDIYQAAIESRGRAEATPCGAGRMAWRVWGDGPPLVLLHGGYGSWTHWIRNVLALAEHFTVMAADLPGLGASDAPPKAYSPAGIADIVSTGIDALIPPPATFDIAGFSFGGHVGGLVAARQGPRVRTLVLVGVSALGLPRAPGPALVPRRPGMTADALAASQRRNLEILMIHDPARIDDLAVHLQTENTRRARVRSRPFARTDELARALPDVEAALKGIWGEHDSTAAPHVDARRALLQRVQPGADFCVIPGAGHWVMYEAPSAFNRALLSVLGAAP